MVVLVRLRACAALLDMCSHNAIASDAIGRERASRRPGSREQAGRLFSATGFLDHKLSLHLYVHTQSETQHFSSCEALTECNEALNGFTHEEPEKVKAIV